METDYKQITLIILRKSRYLSMNILAVLNMVKLQTKSSAGDDETCSILQAKWIWLQEKIWKWSRLWVFCLRVELGS